MNPYQKHEDTEVDHKIDVRVDEAILRVVEEYEEVSKHFDKGRDDFKAQDLSKIETILKSIFNICTVYSGKKKLI